MQVPCLLHITAFIICNVSKKGIIIPGRKDMFFFNHHFEKNQGECAADTKMQEALRQRGISPVVGYSPFTAAQLMMLPTIMPQTVKCTSCMTHWYF